MSDDVRAPQGRRRSWLLGALALALAGCALVAVVALRPGRSRPETVAITIAQSLSSEASAGLRKALDPYQAQHPELQISIVYRSQGTPGNDWGAPPPHLVLRPAANHEVSPSGPGAPVLLSDYVLLAFHKSFVSEPPKTWAELVRVSQLARENGQVRYGLGLPVSADGVLPFLSPALWPNRKTDAPKLAEDAFGLLHDLQFGLGLIPPACTMNCVEREMREGRLPFAVVGEESLTRLRAALGNRLGLGALPPLPGSGAPLRSVRVVFAALAVPVANPLEAGAARDLLSYLRDGKAIEVARALGKTSATASGGDLSELVSKNTVNADPADVDRARKLVQSLWDRFRNGEVSAGLAAREMVAQWTADAAVRND